jgi:hypothetical protein
VLRRLLEAVCAKDGVWLATGSEVCDWYRAHGATEGRP